jgi:hypothetical protein
MSQTKPSSRRKVLHQGTVMLGSIVFIPIAMYLPTASAGSASKKMLHYQDSPKDGQTCADCTAFSPPAASDSITGTCKIVSGEVNPHGWCMAFSPRRQM